MKPPRINRAEPADLRLMPMIDVVFLLLIFFVWTSSFRQPERSLSSKLSLPAGTTEPIERAVTPEIDLGQLTVRLRSRQGALQLSLNQRPVGSLAQLQQQLRQLAAIDSGLPVIIHPDPELRLATVIDVYDIIRGAAFHKVRFAVREKT